MSIPQTVALLTGSFFGGHLMVSGLSIYRGLTSNFLSNKKFPRSPLSPTMKGTENALECVSSMYKTCIVRDDLMSTRVEFEDPAAKCEGVVEVAEAFRALKALSPCNHSFSLAVEQEGRAVSDGMFSPNHDTGASGIRHDSRLHPNGSNF